MKKYHVLLPFLSILFVAGCAFREEHALRRELISEMRATQEEMASRKNSSSALAVLPKIPNLEDYLEYAALNSPALKAAYLRWTAAVEKIPQARSLPDPTLSYSHYIREVESRVGPQRNRFALMQMLPWPTKITSKTDMAVREALSQKYLYDGEKLALFYRVRKAYCEYYYLGRSIQAVRDSLALLQNIESTVRTRYEADAASNPQLIQLQIELGKQEDRLKSLNALRPVLASRLNAAIGREREQDLPQPTEIGSEELPKLDEAGLLNSLEADNPGLKAARAKIKAAKSGERLARAQYFPDFGVGASLIETGRRSDVDIDDNGKDPVMFTVDISLPIWWNKYAAGVREARAAREAAENSLAEKSNQLSADLRLVYYNYSDAARKRDLFIGTLVPKAEQSLAVSRTAFSSGKAQFSDLLNAERTLLELRLMTERAKTDQAILLAELEMLAGKILRQPDSSPQQQNLGK